MKLMKKENYLMLIQINKKINIYIKIYFLNHQKYIFLKETI